MRSLGVEWTGMRSLVWFRSDLRTRDNTALSAATREGGSGVVAVFVVSPGEWREHDVAAVKVDFTLRTLRELSVALASLNIPLVITRAATRGDVPAAVLAVARAHECAALFFNKEYEVNESKRDATTTGLFEKDGRRVVACTDQTLIEPGEVRTGEGRWYTVFSPFKRAAYAWIEKHGGVTERPAPKRQAMMVCEPDAVPERVEGFESTVPGEKWPAGEKHAMSRLRKFADEKIIRYKETRDIPSEPGTSTLSPYLAIGAISPRQCLLAALEANREFVKNGKNPLDSGNEGIVHWISEVLWREFYIHIVKGFPRVCMGRAFQPATEAIRWSENDEHFERWTQGRTGVPIVDAGMRQLLQVGWMHNRVRMVAAMYLTKNLFIDWRRGEKWFMRHLVDGHLPSNNGGWQWSASTGTDAAPYFRIFNPVSQSQRFDPEGTYIRRFVPELADVEGELVHEPWELPMLLKARLEYPEPLVDLSRSRTAAIEAFAALREGR
jgi:deoxyribodipyrimidine photo-lyase